MGAVPLNSHWLKEICFVMVSSDGGAFPTHWKWVGFLKSPLLRIPKIHVLGHIWILTWRIIPVIKWLITMISKSPKQACSPSTWPKWLINGGYQLLTNWDDPPSRDCQTELPRTPVEAPIEVEQVERVRLPPAMQEKEPKKIQIKLFLGCSVSKRNNSFLFVFLLALKFLRA